MPSQAYKPGNPQEPKIEKTLGSGKCAPRTVQAMDVGHHHPSSLQDVVSKQRGINKVGIFGGIDSAQG